MNSKLKDLLEMTGCRDGAHLQDMANVGRSLMDAIDVNIRPGCRYAGWAPADDPAEIVTDLLNDLTDAEEARDRAQRSLRALQEGAALALSQLGAHGDGPVADFLCAIHREAVRGLLASDEVTNECDAGRAALEQG